MFMLSASNLVISEIVATSAILGFEYYKKTLSNACGPRVVFYLVTLPTIQ
jgi:hypothetical protein